MEQTDVLFLDASATECEHPGSDGQRLKWKTAEVDIQCPQLNRDPDQVKDRHVVMRLRSARGVHVPQAALAELETSLDGLGALSVKISRTRA